VEGPARAADRSGDHRGIGRACLAQWVTQPLTVPYLVFVALGAIALGGLWGAPETGAPAPRAAAGSQPAGPRRTVRLPVPRRPGPSPPSPRMACSPGCPGSSSLPRCTSPRTRCPASRFSWCLPAE
jgi:hypothetical protein